MAKICNLPLAKLPPENEKTEEESDNLRERMKIIIPINILNIYTRLQDLLGLDYLAKVIH